MALTGRFFMSCQYMRYITKPVKWNVENYYPLRILTSGICYRSNIRKPFESNDVGLLSTCVRQCSTQNKGDDSPAPDTPKKVGLIQRLKSMYKDYWYVVVPVHIATSIVWFGGIYYFTSSGFDVLALLQNIGLSERLLEPLKHSGAGYVALTFAFYKVVAPLRYAVTLGLTTFAINRLKALGIIKPMPSKARIKEMFQEKKDSFQLNKQQYQSQMKERRTQMMDEMRRYKQQMKEKVKKM